VESRFAALLRVLIALFTYVVYTNAAEIEIYDDLLAEFGENAANTIVRSLSSPLFKLTLNSGLQLHLPAR
jgi:hypothetical protein